MKYLPYVLRHLRRNKIRTLSTIVALAVCIFLFCTLQTVLAAVRWGLQSANASRLITQHSVSLVFNIPLAYEARIAAVPGVKRVAITSWFGGTLPAKKEGKGAKSGDVDWSNFFTNLAVEAEPFFAMSPELQVPPDQMKAFLQDQQGCVIGRALADKYGWKPGDRFSLDSFIAPYRRREGPFEFTVRAIYDVDEVKNPGADARIMYFHYKYMYEGTGRRNGAGTYTIELEDPSQAGRVSKEIDALFENSDAETSTGTEAQFRASFVAMAGNLALLLNGIGTAVIFTILLVTANTMSMAVRERRTEIAVLKTLGFGSGLVMALILGEALTLGVLGGVIGTGLSSVLITGLRQAPMLGDALRQYPNVGLSAQTAGLGLVLGLVIALAGGFVPALLAYRARITALLRTV